MKTRNKCPQCSVILGFDREKLSTVKCPKCGFNGKVSDYAEIVLRTGYCPNCQTALQLPVNTDKKTITCPKCRQSAADSAFSATKKEEGDTKTQTNMGAYRNRLYKPGKLLFVQGDAQWLSPEKGIMLRHGANTLGRLSSSSACTIQLPTDDPYMSRNHATIEVVMKPTGVFAHYLQDNGSINGTFHNGDRLEQGDIIDLSPGDAVRLGHTTLKLVVE
jgi:Zn-finger nucleic acid-binding protein